MSPFLASNFSRARHPCARNDCIDPTSPSRNKPTSGRRPTHTPSFTTLQALVAPAPPPLPPPRRLAQPGRLRPPARQPRPSSPPAHVSPPPPLSRTCPALLRTYRRGLSESSLSPTPRSRRPARRWCSWTLSRRPTTRTRGCRRRRCRSTRAAAGAGPGKSPAGSHSHSSESQRVSASLSEEREHAMFTATSCSVGGGVLAIAD